MDDTETKAEESVPAAQEENAEETVSQNEILYRHFIRMVLGAYLIYLAYRTYSARADIPAERLVFIIAAAAVFLLAGIWFTAGSAVRLIRDSKLPPKEGPAAREEENEAERSASQATDKSDHLE
jgi:hypothetical protein